MDHQKPTLIIIPGLGDRVWWYRKLLPIWSRLGYSAQIFSFDWEVPTKSFEESFAELLNEIDAHPAPVYLIGASAGGSAAMNALQSRPKSVKKVATVAATFRYDPQLNNPKLKDSIEHLFSQGHALLTDNALSLYGIYDQKVPTSSTKRIDALARRIPILGHGAIIITALTIYAHSISRFFKT